MSARKIVCAHCGKKAFKKAGEVSRARKAGLSLYCNRKCSGLGRRTGKTKAQKVAEKRAYDEQYRQQNRDMLKAKKREYFQRTYDPKKAAKHRKARMPYHVEYCRQPEYRAKKQDYDRHRRAAEYGPFADAYVVLSQLNAEIATRMSRYEIYVANGTLNKRLQRKREHEERSCF